MNNQSEALATPVDLDRPRRPRAALLRATMLLAGAAPLAAAAALGAVKWPVEAGD